MCAAKLLSARRGYSGLATLTTVGGAKAPILLLSTLAGVLSVVQLGLGTEGVHPVELWTVCAEIWLGRPHRPFFCCLPLLAGLKNTTKRLFYGAAFVDAFVRGILVELLE